MQSTSQQKFIVFQSITFNSETNTIIIVTYTAPQSVYLISKEIFDSCMNSLRFIEKQEILENFVFCRFGFFNVIYFSIILDI